MGLGQIENFKLTALSCCVWISLNTSVTSTKEDPKENGIEKKRLFKLLVDIFSHFVNWDQIL